jgi:hypothetical protein
MKLIITVACAVACVCSLDAQISANVDRSPGGLEHISVRNNSKVALVAFVVRATPSALPPEWPVVPSLTFFDALEGGRDVLAPGDERAMRAVAVPAGRHVFEEPIAAAIFADGSATGDPELLRLLLSYRSNRLAAIETALETLAEAGQGNVSRDQLVAQFKKMADASRRWYVPEEERSAARVYQSIVDKLVNLPEQELGAPFPPTAFVRDEVASLSRQRAVLLDSQPSLSAALAR